MKPEIHVCFCLDRGYLDPFKVALKSLETHLPEGSVVHCHIISHDSLVIEFARNQLPLRNSTYLHPHAISAESLSRFRPGSAYISVATFLRFFIDQLSDGIGRILYLDPDILVMKDISPLYEHPFDGRHLVAVQDYRNSYFSRSFSNTAAMPLVHDPAAPYFNAGMLLFDLNHYRESRMRERLEKLNLELGGMIDHADQDLLNLAYQGDVTFINPEWNLQYPFGFVTFTKPRKFLFDRTSCRKAYHSPGIIHWVGPDKPWKSNRNPLAYLYRRFTQGNSNEPSPPSRLRLVALQAYFFIADLKHALLSVLR